MQRVELTKATMQGWSRLDPERHDKFFEALVRAALRLDRLQFPEWLRKRLRSHPLAPPVGPAAFAISDDMVALVVTFRILSYQQEHNKQDACHRRAHWQTEHVPTTRDEVTNDGPRCADCNDRQPVERQQAERTPPSD
jgi:hypothetical protein